MVHPEAREGRLLAGRYRLGHLVGHGGMAWVWSARDEVLNRDVAVKQVLLPADLTAEQREEIRERTMREARAAARLTHPNLVTVYDVVEDDANPWIVMELLPPRTLADVLATEGPVTPQVAAGIGADLADALRAAHAAGVLHRDVKPANVMLTEGRAVLTDFGIALVEEDPTLTVTGVLIGSPGYMSPERARGERPTPASDLWSLGATLYAAVEGQGSGAFLDRPICQMCPWRCRRCANARRTSRRSRTSSSAGSRPS
jgi:serine/threonine protein kinase